MRKTLSAIREQGSPLSTVSRAWVRVTRLRDGIIHFDWKSAIFATWVFLAILGAIALGAWFANPLRWLALAASLLAVAGGWCITFKLTQAVRGYHAAHAKQIPVARPLRSVGFHTKQPAPAAIAQAGPLEYEPDVESILVNLGYTPKNAKLAVRKVRYLNCSGMDATVAAALQSLQLGGAM
jgi:hypothetical protein